MKIVLTRFAARRSFDGHSAWPVYGPLTVFGTAEMTTVWHWNWAAAYYARPSTAIRRLGSTRTRFFGSSLAFARRRKTKEWRPKRETRRPASDRVRVVQRGWRSVGLSGGDDSGLTTTTTDGERAAGGRLRVHCYAVGVELNANGESRLATTTQPLRRVVRTHTLRPVVTHTHTRRATSAETTTTVGLD